MPTILRFQGFRLFFFSLEHLPIHVHIENADSECKFEINPVKLIWNKGMKEPDVRKAEEIVKQHKRLIESKCLEYFGSNN
ncbi:MAG TPA: DUF4160 domain-containing protein [Flavipsychrobacter sp.]|nr:DUF4160 domain-containing protein [Flavipsychrobacter sp.]